MDVYAANLISSVSSATRPANADDVTQAAVQFNTSVAPLVPSLACTGHMYCSTGNARHYDAVEGGISLGSLPPCRGLPGGVYGWSPLFALLLDRQKGVRGFIPVSRALTSVWLSGKPSYVSALLTTPTSADSTPSQRSPLGVTTAPDVVVDVLLCILGRLLDTPCPEGSSVVDVYLCVRLVGEVSRCLRGEVEAGGHSASGANRASVFMCALMRLAECMPLVITVLHMASSGGPTLPVHNALALSPFALVEVCCEAMQQGSFTTAGREWWLRSVGLVGEEICAINILVELLFVAVPVTPLRSHSANGPTHLEQSLRCHTAILMALQVATRDLAVCRSLLDAGAVPLLLSELDTLRRARGSSAPSSSVHALYGRALSSLAGIIQNMPRDRGCLAALRRCNAVESVLNALLLDLSATEVDPHLQMLACKVILNMHEGDESSRAALRRVLAAAVAEQHVHSIVHSL